MGKIHDDPASWDALATRMTARVMSAIAARRARDSSWRGARVWGPPLATAAVLTLLIARAAGVSVSDRGGDPVTRDPTTRVMTAPGRAPSVVLLLASDGRAQGDRPPSVGALMFAQP